MPCEPNETRCWRGNCTTRSTRNSSAARDRARDLCQDLNATREAETRSARRRILTELFGTGGETVWMQPPFFCDYGSNILLGERVFFNFNCVVLDVCRVTIGDFTLFGPAVQIYTATHPMNAELRRKQEFAKPIEIGSDVWVGGGAIICPGVKIGSRSVIGAGQRGHAGHPRGRVRRRQPVPGHPGDHGVGPTSTSPQCASKGKELDPCLCCGLVEL